MKSKLALFLLLYSSLYADQEIEKAKKLIASGYYKEAISLLTPEEGSLSGEYAKMAAIAYYKDQEHEKAFKAFLSALIPKPKLQEPYRLSKEESRYYQEALKVYLDSRERDPAEMSARIRDIYGGTYRLHPEFADLGYLVALAYANLGDYPTFFEIFYRSYQSDPDNYLAYKAQGILHLKLFDRARTPFEKTELRKLVIENFKKAKGLYPHDASLYKMEIAFSQDKEQALESNLKEIMDKDIVIPRLDLSFYFDQLLAHRQNMLAEEFLKKARKWYPYSKVLDAADESLKQKMEEK